MVARICLAILCFTNAATAQVSVVDSAWFVDYAFINTDHAVLVGDTSRLESWRGRVDTFRHQPGGKLTVLHIGDSHVQAGHFTLPVAQLFHDVYGNGGMGMVFPYRVAKTNGPPGYATSSNAAWIGKRNSVYKNNLPTGVAGHTVYTRDSSAVLTWKMDSAGLSGLVKTVRVFHASTADSNFHYVVTDTGGTPAVYNSERSNDRMSFFEFGQPVMAFRIGHQGMAARQVSSTITGVFVENGHQGSTVSAIGVNGAKYADYLASPWFKDQVSMLAPDLIVVSLGTNEAFEFNGYTDDAFARQVDALLRLFLDLPSKPLVVASTPPAVSRRTRGKKGYVYVPNPLIPRIRNVIMLTAAQNRVPVFDLHEAMGGHHSMRQWHAKGMTDKPRIHFSKKGYLITGALLADALRKHVAR